ncbi:hypothetical protein THRCLA_06570 [Thraustotheca clavata]|uniref:Uncharacterized protein n=1 Tax=Thraustotheca clavata TaxID=74557 RepID=A0A1V9ZMN0_9STRA|nr:hypothetical protein THRCLA_06570 [Thraustotheca clavata]
MSVEDEFLSVLTDGIVHQGILLGETWESLCQRKYKPPPSGITLVITTRKKDLTDAEVQLAAQLYQEGLKDNSELDLDDVMQHVLDQREVKQSKWDYTRAQKLQSFFTRLSKPVLVRIKRKTLPEAQAKPFGQGKAQTEEMSALQFATYFGEYHVVQALLPFEPQHATQAFLDACREGYAQIAQYLLESTTADLDIHCISHGFLLATEHEHLQVLKKIQAVQQTRLDTLCHGSAFSGFQLGQRYIAVAVEIALLKANSDILRWLVELNLMFDHEWNHCIQYGLRLACGIGKSHIYIPVLLLLLEVLAPKVASVALGSTTPHDMKPDDIERFKAIKANLLYDFYSNHLQNGTID